MRGYRKYLVGISSAAMVFATMAPALMANAQTVATPAFSDISGNSHASAITAEFDAGIINGIGNGMFGPGTLVTRAEMAKIVVNLANEGAVSAALADETPAFTDASTIPSWAWGPVNVASDMGIINGFPNGTFQPNGYVTDAEAAAMLLRAIGDAHPGVIVGSWPGNYVAAAINLGLTNGISHFVAGLPATRGEIAQMVYNAALVVPVAQMVPNSNPAIWSTDQSGVTYKSYGQIGGDSIFTGTVESANTNQVTVNGTTYTLASSYSLVGASNVVDLINQGVTVELNSGDVVYIAANASVTPSSGTISSVNYDGNSALDFSSGSSVTYNGSTVYYVNSPSSGALTDSNASVSAATYLSTGDSVSYTLQSNGDAATVTESNWTILNGVITGVCTSSCSNENSGGSAVVSVVYSGAPGASGAQSDSVTVQPYTQITLNGQAATLSQLSSNDTVSVAIVGGNGQNGASFGSDTLTGTSGLGDGNAVAISATSNTASGTVTTVNTTNGAISSFDLSTQSSPISVDSQWVTPANFGLNSTVTVYLDSNGDARAATVTSAESLGQVAIVTGVNETQSVSSTTYTYTLSTSSGSVSVTVPAASFQNVATGTPVFEGGTGGSPTLNVMSADGSGWTVVDNTEASGAVTLTSSSGTMTITTPNAVFNESNGYLGYTGLQNGDAVNLYDVTVSGTTYYLIQDTVR